MHWWRISVCGFFFFFSSRRRHTRFDCDWSSDVCSSDLTEARLGPAIARLGLGLVILPHALQKTLGWFGGYGFSGTFDSFTKQMGLPGWLRSEERRVGKECRSPVAPYLYIKKRYLSW